MKIGVVKNLKHGTAIRAPSFKHIQPDISHMTYGPRLSEAIQFS
jgi:hypothetical protein